MQFFCELCGLAAFDPAASNYDLRRWAVGDKAHLLTCPSCFKELSLEQGADKLRSRAVKLARGFEKSQEEGRRLIVTAAIVEAFDSTILVAKRSDGSAGGGDWEFPGGKVEPGEDLVACIHREMLEELEAEIIEPKPFFMVDHSYSAFDIRLCSFITRFRTGRLSIHAHCQIRWVQPDELDSVDFSDADVKLAKAYLEHRLR